MANEAKDTVVVRGKGKGKSDSMGMITHKSLPQFFTHGFVEHKGEVVTPTTEMIRKHLRETRAAYLEQPADTVIRVKDPNTGVITTTTLGQYTGSVEEVFKAVVQHERAYSKDLCDTHSLDAGNYDLSKFMVSCQWETMTTAPYANATAVFKMPTGLANYLLHGSIAKVDDDNDKNVVFRHIETGGWASIRFPAMYEGSDKPTYRTVFFGKILGINLKSAIDPSTGVFESQITLTIGSFITPMTLGETRKTVFRKGAIGRIDPAAMAGYQSGSNKIIEALIASLKRAGGGDMSRQDMYDALHQIIEAFGHMQLPTSLAGLDPNTGRPHRIGNHIGIMGNYSDQSMATIFLKNSSDINRISNTIIKEQYFTGAFRGGASAIWGIIQQLFQPDTTLIELFPVMIPLGKEESADSRAAGSGGDRVNGVFKNSVLTDNLKAVPYIMYRYKPMPPTFHGDMQSVNGNYNRTSGLRADVTEETYHSKYFGQYNTDSDMGLSSFVNLNKQRVMQVDLTWSEAKRINAVHLGHPFSQGTGSNNLFGVECVPVFNVEDINRHGLRMINSVTPFRVKPIAATDDILRIKALQNSEKRRDQRKVTAQMAAKVQEFEKRVAEQRESQRIASSAYAERYYYLRGEGHAYADGQIVLSYYPDPDLIAGIWCQIPFMGMNRLNTAKVDKPLTFYCTAIRHNVSIDPVSGVPQGTTVLTVERASYNNRVPTVDLKQVPLQAPPAPPEDTGKTKTKTKARKGKR